MFWKIYSVGWLLLFTIYVHHPHDASAWADFTVSALGFVALLGYAFNHGFFHRRFWQGVFWALIALNAYGHVISRRESLAVQVIAFVLLLPAFVGVFRYAYSSPAFWDSGEARAV